MHKWRVEGTGASLMGAGGEIGNHHVQIPVGEDYRVVGACGYFLKIASLFSMNREARSSPENEERGENVGGSRGRKSQCEIIVKGSDNM